jgi:hypothetical protein
MRIFHQQSLAARDFPAKNNRRLFVHSFADYHLAESKFLGGEKWQLDRLH